jgi:hypothetical protein
MGRFKPLDMQRLDAPHPSNMVNMGLSATGTLSHYASEQDGAPRLLKLMLEPGRLPV